mgnify:CR=1 FL=1
MDIGISAESVETHPVIGVEGWVQLGGYCGPAIKPIALRCVFQVAQALPHVPICGIGGIRTGRDAVEFYTRKKVVTARWAQS